MHINVYIYSYIYIYTYKYIYIYIYIYCTLFDHLAVSITMMISVVVYPIILNTLVVYFIAFFKYEDGVLFYQRDMAF